MEFINNIPRDVTNFILVTIFALLIGLEQKKLHERQNRETQFGTDRTFALIGVLGYVLYLLNPSSLIPFLIGFSALVAFLLMFYYFKLNVANLTGLTSILAALLTYNLAPMIYSQPHWLVLLVIVGILILLEIKEDLTKLSHQISSTEFITLAKFIVIAGIILPLLPNKPIFEFISFSPYKFWLAIVVVSSISYISYLLQKFVFPKSGILLTGILGGLYSSTATTVVLARKSKEGGSKIKISAAILLATTMMYLRLLILAFIFSKVIAIALLPFFIPLAVLSTSVAGYYALKSSKETLPFIKETNKNPLEFKTAFVFGLLFIIFSYITDIILKQYGHQGIKALSLLVGVTDIDPFILNLFQINKATFSTNLIVQATVLATMSNAMLKMVYAIILGDKSLRRSLIVGFMLLIVVSIVLLITI
jgi:uncharacterized membrane protein (DUF4010 family)